MDNELELRQKVEELERLLMRHMGPQPGATSLQRPHTGVPYLDNGEIPIDLLPTGDADTEVALGSHTHITGYYL